LAGTLPAPVGAAERLPRMGLPHRILEAGGADRFDLALEAGEFLQLAVEQLGIDVGVNLFSPDGKLLAGVDTPTGTRGAERLCWIAEASGVHAVEVRALDPVAEAGAYAIAIEQRSARPGDRTRVEAQQAFAKAYAMQQRPDSLARNEILALFSQAFQGWQASGDSYLAGIALNSVAQVHALNGEYRRAISCYDDALVVRRAAGDLSGEAYSLTSMALLEQEVGLLPPALSHHRQALELERLLGDHGMEAQVLGNIGRLQNSTGDKTAAMRSYVEALSLARSARDSDLEAHTLNRIAGLYESQGLKQKAIEHYGMALSSYAARGNRHYVAITSGNLGRVYADLGELEAATVYFNRSLEAVRELGDRHSEGMILVGLGRVYAASGENERAREHFERALPLLRSVGDPRSEATALLGIGGTRLEEGLFPEASAYFDRALSIARAVEDPYREADGLTLLGVAKAGAGDRRAAEADLRTAIERRQKIGDRPGEAWSSYELARVLRADGRLAEAAGLLEEALRGAESLRGSLASTTARSAFFGSAQRYYAEYVDLLLSELRSDPASAVRAFEASERARGRSLLDVVSESRSDVARSVDSTVLERQAAARRRLDALVQGKIDGSIPASGGVQADHEIESLLLELEALEATARSQDPRYADLTRPEPLSLGAVQREVLDDDTLLLEYWLGSGRSYLWVVSRNSIEVHILPAGQVIEAAALRLLSSVAAPPPTSGPPGGFAREARELGQMLLEPIPNLARAERLLIVPDGVLYYVPFEALQIEGGQPSVSRHVVATAPSASAIAALRRQIDRASNSAPTLAVFADPVFGPSDPRVAARGDHPKGAATPPLDLPRLPFTRREAAGIAAALGASQVRSFLDFDANLQSATSPELTGFSFLHFATHGILDAAHPELSGLVFSTVDPHGAGQPGFLSAGDVLALRFSADLVTLSGCRTALGRQIRGEGLVGLTRAFFYAGARRVLASLWRVDDAATAELMKRLYEGMLGQKRLAPAAALREAQLWMMKQPRWRDPYYWAGFVLQGEWN
jgi:CHAT domain-containing protein/tetratricopeptide (TPR) repeat protein